MLYTIYQGEKRLWPFTYFLSRTILSSVVI